MTKIKREFIGVSLWGKTFTSSITSVLHAGGFLASGTGFPKWPQPFRCRPCAKGVMVFGLPCSLTVPKWPVSSEESYSVLDWGAAQELPLPLLYLESESFFPSSRGQTQDTFQLKFMFCLNLEW